MRLWMVMLIICSLGIAAALYTPYYEEKQCIKLETGPTGTLKDNEFCDSDGCRPLTVDYEVVEC